MNVAELKMRISMSLIRFLRSTLFIGVITVFLLVNTTASGLPLFSFNSAQKANIEYVISVPDPSNHAVHIRMVVTDIPADCNSVFRIRTPPHPIKFTITDLEGRPIPFEVESFVSRLGIPYTEVRIQPSNNLVIEYSICDLSPSARIFTGCGWGYIGEDFGITLEAQLLLSPGWGWMEYGTCYEVEQSTFTFKLPEGWIAVMAHEKLDDNIYKMDGTPAELPGVGPDRRSGCFIAFGPFNAYVKTFNGHSLVMAIHQDIEYPETLVEASLKLIQHYGRVFGSKPLLKRLLVIVLPAQAEEAGMLVGMYAEASVYEVVKTNQAEYFDYFQLVNFALHFPTFWLRDFGAWGDAGWFVNGLRFYLYMPAMVEVFGISEREYKQHLYNVWLTYQERTKNKPPTSLIEDTCLNAELKVQLFGYMLDREIREKTNGEKSFNDVIAYIYETYALKGKPFNTESFVKAVNMVTGVDFTDFMENCLLYTSPSPRDLSTSRMPSSA